MATTRITAEGLATTELSITLRNRLRHSLRLRLPEGVVVRTSLLDGEAVKPSRDSEGTLLLPLKRSSGTERPRPFTLRLSLESDVGRLGVLGLRRLSLPSFELPVSTLRWEVEAPAAHRYSRLFGDIAPQGEDESRASIFASATPPLRTTRYWLQAEQPLSVRFAHLRGWVQAPLALVGALALAMSALAARRRWPDWSRSARLRAGMTLVAAAALLAWAAGDSVLLFAVLVAAGAGGLFAEARTLAPHLWSALRRPAETAPTPGSWRAHGLLGRAALLLSTGFVALLLLVGLLRLLDVLGSPLG